jgi:hypothetical protein
MAVVTIEAPLNIMYVDPDINASPMYWSIDEKASEHAGMANIYLLCGVFPYYNGILAFSP